MGLQSPASLCEPHSCSECALHVPAAGCPWQSPHWTHVSCSALALSPWGESCRGSFANSWSSLNSIPAEYMCPWLVPKQNSPSLGAPLTSPSGEPPPLLAQTLPSELPTLNFDFSRASGSSCPAPHHCTGGSLCLEFDVWADFYLYLRFKLHMPWKGCDWKGNSRVQGGPGIRQPVWYSPLNSGFLLNTVPLKWRLPAISPARGAYTRSAENCDLEPAQYDAHPTGLPWQGNTFTEGKRESGERVQGFFLDCVFSWKKRNLWPSCWALLSEARPCELPPAGLLTLCN